MGMSAFGVEHPDISKSLANVGARAARKIGAPATMGRTVGAKVDGAVQFGQNAVKRGVLKPLRFTPAGIRPTTAGYAYGAGATGLAGGLAMGGGRRNRPS